MTSKMRIAIHKFSSCDGCQLSLLNLGQQLLRLLSRIEIVHFAEMGVIDESAEADISFIEGSVSTEREKLRLKLIREQSRWVVAIGACATSGGIQAMRNDHDGEQWLASIYPTVAHMDFLTASNPLSDFIYIDDQLWGCPINPMQLISLLNDRQLGVKTKSVDEKLCMECKRQQRVCTLVSQGQCCMGPITRGGCGVLCPSVDSACYGCFGPAENVNAKRLQQQFVAQGMSEQAATQRIRYIHSQQPALDLN